MGVKYEINLLRAAADYSIAFKFGTEFYLVTGDTQQMFQVKGQGHSVQYHVSAAKTLYYGGV